MNNFSHSALAIFLAALITLLLRAGPFLLLGFQRQLPASMIFLGRCLPPAIMAILVIYCLKDIQLWQYPHGLAEALALALVILMHCWKENALLSISAGTACYIILSRVVLS